MAITLHVTGSMHTSLVAALIVYNVLGKIQHAGHRFLEAFRGCQSNISSTAQALKEVYLPECGVWVSDYPFLSRNAFLDLSLEIERERQAQMATP